MDWAASTYLGIKINYNRTAPCIALSMPGYVTAALRRFNVKRASKPNHSPLVCEPIRYGSHTQSVTEDTSPALVLHLINWHLGGLVPLKIHHFLQYAATWPSAELIFVPSNMRLAIWSADASSYLSESDSRFRAGGHHSLTTFTDFSGHLSMAQWRKLVSFSQPSEAEVGPGWWHDWTREPGR